jgi:stage III sporulation protein AB
MKLLGIAFLSLIPLLLSFRAGEELRGTARRREAFLKLLLRMHFQIENFSRDQKEIFDGFDSAILRKTPFYEDLLRELKRAPSGAFACAWKRHGELFAFDTESRELLDVFADHFGFLEKRAQLSELGSVIRHLEKKEAIRKAEWENKAKILRISGITAGLGIFILLI